MAPYQFYFSSALTSFTKLFLKFIYFSESQETNKTYLFCYCYGETCRPHVEAKNYCHGQGGILFEPRNENEFNEIVEEVKYTLDSYWIGVDDTKIEGTFVYGDNLPITWNKWKTDPEEPYGNGNCVELNEAFAQIWHQN